MLRIAHALIVLGDTVQTRGDIATARCLLDEAVAVSRRAGATVELVDALHYAGGDALAASFVGADLRAAGCRAAGQDVDCVIDRRGGVSVAAGGHRSAGGPGISWRGRIPRFRGTCPTAALRRRRSHARAARRRRRRFERCASAHAWSTRHRQGRTPQPAHHVASYPPVQRPISGLRQRCRRR
jgi:hypothetical protein